MKVREFSQWAAENDDVVQLGATAGEGRIKDAEKKMGGVVVPGPLRELYRLHDGVEMAHGYIPPLAGESSLPEMLEIIKQADLGWDLKKWVPFFDYQNGEYDAMDVASPKGLVARLDPKTGEMKEIATTFEAWLDLAVRATEEFQADAREADES